MSERPRTVVEKIAAALDRLSAATRALQWQVATAHGLSPLQLEILLALAERRSEPQRIGALAERCGVRSSTLSDAAAALVAKALVVRVPDTSDHRAAPIALTAAGERVAALISAWSEPLDEEIARLTPDDQLALMSLLLRLVDNLERRGVIAHAHLCLNCRYFQPETYPGSATPHHCSLLDRPLGPADLRIGCPEYEHAST